MRNAGRKVNLTGTLGADNTLQRVKLSDIVDAPRQGRICSIIVHFDTIAGGAANAAKMTLGHKDVDSRYILPSVVTEPIEIDAGTATLGTIVKSVNEEPFVIDDTMFADITNYSGWWFGLQLDIGTANAEIIVCIEES